MSQAALPQLLMRRDDLTGLPLVEPPPGVAIRPAVSDDAAAIAACLANAFGEPWTVARVERELLSHPEVLVTFIAVIDGTIVATASAAWQPSRFGDAGVLHWVAALPGYGGKGLGGLVSLAALRHCAAEGLVAAMLLTDDARIPAIRTYRRLGFRPFHHHRSHPARWQAVLAAIG
jgi:mycothiol synthase